MREIFTTLRKYLTELGVFMKMFYELSRLAVIEKETIRSVI